MQSFYLSRDTIPEAFQTVYGSSVELRMLCHRELEVWTVELRNQIVQDLRAH